MEQHGERNWCPFFMAIWRERERRQQLEEGCLDVESSFPVHEEHQAAQSDDAHSDMHMEDVSSVPAYTPQSHGPIDERHAVGINDESNSYALTNFTPSIPVPTTEDESRKRRSDEELEGDQKKVYQEGEALSASLDSLHLYRPVDVPST